MDAVLPVRFTKEGLKSIMPLASDKHLELYCEPINNTLAKYDINTPLRSAAFIAQMAHETGQLQWMAELASGEAYENRHDLGNTEVGDGKRFKGRGGFQITGRTNYGLYSKYTGVDFIAKPELLEGPVYAIDSAGWYWSVFKKLNRYADLGMQIMIQTAPPKPAYTAFMIITTRINGGLTHQDERQKYYESAKKLLGI